jgi:hypothetical protein
MKFNRVFYLFPVGNCLRPQKGKGVTFYQNITSLLLKPLGGCGRNEEGR